MEGPAAELIVTLSQDQANPTTRCALAEDPNTFGLPSRGRKPRIVSETIGLPVYNDIGAASGAKSGAKWYVRWNEASERYFFDRPVRPAPSCVLRRFRATSTIAAATGLPATTWGVGIAQIYDDDGLPDGAPKAIANPFKDGFPNSSGGWVDISKTTPVIVSVGCTLS
jgi:hypothetical protein